MRFRCWRSWAVALGTFLLVGELTLGATAYGSSALSGSGSVVASLLAARQSVDSARSVRIQGTVHQATASYAVDEMLFADGDSSGTVTVNGELARLVIVGGWYYFNGSSGFWTHVFAQAPANARKLSTEWIGVPSSSITGLGANLSLDHLRSGFDLSGNARLTDLGTSQVDGEAAIGVRISGKGTLWIAKRSLRPVSFDGMNGANLVMLRFSDWGGGSTPTVPPGAIRFSNTDGAAVTSVTVPSATPPSGSTPAASGLLT